MSQMPKLVQKACHNFETSANGEIEAFANAPSVTARNLPNKQTQTGLCNNKITLPLVCKEICATIGPCLMGSQHPVSSHVTKLVFSQGACVQLSSSTTRDDYKLGRETELSDGRRNDD